MRNIFKKLTDRIRSNMADKTLRLVVVLMLFLAPLHFWQYCHCLKCHQTIIKGSGMLLFAFFVIFNGRRHLDAMATLYGVLIMYENRFNNYTSFVLLYLCARLTPRRQSLFIVIYSGTLVYCLLKSNLTASHAAIHVFNCALLAIAFETVFPRNRRSAYFTPDEERILSELADGKQKKQITCFSRNIVYKKLNECVRRNGARDYDELVRMYRDEMNTRGNDIDTPEDGRFD